MTTKTNTRPATYTTTRPACVLIEQPTRQYGRQATQLEVSAQIDTTTRKLTTRYNDPAQVEYTYRLLRYPGDTAAQYQSERTAEQITSAEAITKAKQLINRSLAAQKRLITAGKKHPAYYAMRTIVEKTVKHYESDFYYHDTITLANHPKINFIWIVREYGTHIIIDPRQLETVNYCSRNNPDAKFYAWSNGKLAPIIGEMAAALTSQMKKLDD